VNGAKFLLIAALASPTLAAPGDDAVRAGNELYRAGAYEDALAQYSQADDSGALALFNRACALQRLGRSDEAQELLQTVDAMARRDDLAASARYNLGAASVEQARTLASGGQAAEALDAYKRAARLYRDAYAINPSDHDAARNIEIAGREAKALLDQIRAQEQMREQLQNLQQQQEQESQENESSPSSQPGEDGEPSESDEQQQSDQLEAAQRQQSISEQTEAARDQLRDMQEQMQQSQQGSTAAAQQDPLDRAAQRVEDAMQDQQRAQEQLERGDQESASESQRAAAEDLEQALREMNGEPSPGDDAESGEGEDTTESESESADTDQDAQSENEQQNEQERSEEDSAGEQQDGQGQSQESTASDGGSGKAGDEPADPLEALAEDLLEKEKDDRERLQRIRAQRRATNAPVEKDW